MEKPFLFLIHGALGTGNQLLLLLKKLENDFSCEIIELPFHGKTEGDINFDAPSFSRYIDDLISSKNIEICYIFGYSMGGFLACLCHIKGNKSIKAIYSLGTKFIWNLEEAIKETAFLIPEKMEEKVPAFVQKLEALHPIFGWKNMVSKTALLMTQLGEKNPLSISLLAQISIPVCVSTGENDIMVTPKDAAIISNQIPNSSLSIIPKSAHSLDKIDLDFLKQDIIEFFKNAPCSK